mgnify:CR=1 FL=1
MAVFWMPLSGGVFHKLPLWFIWITSLGFTSERRITSLCSLGESSSPLAKARMARPSRLQPVVK